MPDRQKEELTVEDVLDNASARMAKSVEVLNRELSSIRTGRASTSLVESILVDYYGVPTPLNQMASIAAPEARLITIQPWDKQSLSSVEKSLLKSEMGFNPTNDGSIIRVPIPPLTQERRKELVRLLKRTVEDSKVAVRNVRRDSLERLRTMERNKKISQDDDRRAQERLQKVTDTYVSQADQTSSSKEAEIMQV